MTSPPLPPSPPEGPPRAVCLVRSQRTTPSPTLPEDTWIVTSSTNAIPHLPYNLPAFGEEQLGFFIFERLSLAAFFYNNELIAAVSRRLFDGHRGGALLLPCGDERSAGLFFFCAYSCIVPLLKARQRFSDCRFDMLF